MPSVTIRAFAKINLSLRITGVRPDGFHEVRTILQAIDLYDRVTCESRRGPFQIRCDVPGVPTDDSNLVWKAARLVWEGAGRTGDLRDAVISLRKHIPMQAGLGGGSSNAAAALLGLRRLWKLRLSDEQLRGLAARLGSDVPFFLIGGTALGLGRGEEVYPLENLPPYWVVLAIPPFGVATKDAYRWFDEAPSPAPGVSSPVFPHVRLANDLEPPVIGRHADIGALKQRFADRRAVLAAMSGSGSTVFGIFKTQAEAKRAARSVNAEGGRVVTARFLSRSTRPPG